MPTTLPHVVDVTDFQQQVIQASHEQPVLIDFWASWCGPCRALTPVLEGLASEAGGRWRLAKVSTEQHPHIAQQYGVRGIPNVKLMIDGQIVGEFTGALPKPQVQAFLKQHLPPSSSEKLLLEAQTAYTTGDSTTAEQKLAEYHSCTATPAPEARLLEAQLTFFEQPEAALALIEDINAASPLHQAAHALRQLAHLLHEAQQSQSLPEGPGKERYLQGLKHLQNQDFHAALEVWIAQLQADKAYHDEASRKACIAVFNYLGPQHAVTLALRRRFDMSLY